MPTEHPQHEPEPVVEGAPPAAPEPGMEVDVRRAPAPAPVTQDPIALGQVLAASGYFKDATDAAQAAVKVMAGQELGFGPIASMTNVHIIRTGEGTDNERVTVQVGGPLIAAKIQGSERYRYRVVQRTDRICELAFFEKDPITGQWTEFPDHITFTIEDAARAGLANRGTWKAYPRKMLFWRAISDGADVYCPDLFGGNQVEAAELHQDDTPAIAAPAGGADRTTGHAGLPPAPSAAQVIDTRAQAQGEKATAPAASGQRTGSEKTVSAAQKRKLWAEADKAGIKEDESLLRLLIWWYADDTEHSDRIPARLFDDVLKAVQHPQDSLDEIIALASDGDERARLALETYKPDRLPPAPEQPLGDGDGDEQLDLGGEGQ